MSLKLKSLTQSNVCRNTDMTCKIHTLLLSRILSLHLDIMVGVKQWLPDSVRLNSAMTSFHAILGQVETRASREQGFSLVRSHCFTSTDIISVYVYVYVYKVPLLELIHNKNMYIMQHVHILEYKDQYIESLFQDL